MRIISIGVGIENYNDQLLEQLAQYGNGWYRYLDTVDQARTVFSRANWLALSIPFADQTRAQVTWDPNTVASWRLIWRYRTYPSAAYTLEVNAGEVDRFGIRVGDEVDFENIRGGC